MQGSLEGLNRQDPGRVPVSPFSPSSRLARSCEADEKARLGQPGPYVVFQHQSGRYPYYHEDRTHHGLLKETPGKRPVEPRPSEHARLVALPRAGGLYHRYRWDAAA